LRKKEKRGLIFLKKATTMVRHLLFTHKNTNFQADRFRHQYSLFRVDQEPTC